MKVSPRNVHFEFFHGNYNCVWILGVYGNGKESIKKTQIECIIEWDEAHLMPTVPISDIRGFEQALHVNDKCYMVRWTGRQPRPGTSAEAAGTEPSPMDIDERTIKKPSHRTSLPKMLNGICKKCALAFGRSSHSFNSVDCPIKVT